MRRKHLIWALAVLAASACQKAPRTGLDFPGDFPERLSEWHLLEQRAGKLAPNDGVTAYDLNSPLFSDYAHKLRTVLLPPGTSIRYGEDAFESGAAMLVGWLTSPGEVSLEYATEIAADLGTLTAGLHAAVADGRGLPEMAPREATRAEVRDRRRLADAALVVEDRDDAQPLEISASHPHCGAIRGGSGGGGRAPGAPSLQRPGSRPQVPHHAPGHGTGMRASSMLPSGETNSSGRPGRSSGCRSAPRVPFSPRAPSPSPR